MSLLVIDYLLRFMFMGHTSKYIARVYLLLKLLAVIERAT